MYNFDSRMNTELEGKEDACEMNNHKRDEETKTLFLLLLFLFGHSDHFACLHGFL